MLPVPGWMTFKTTRVPSEDDVRPWFDAVCALWDDPAVYAELGRRGRQIAAARYSEEVSRRRHVEYFTSLDTRRDPIVVG